VIDQPFGAGRAVLFGFDAWYRAWTQQEERLVLSGLLYPTGSSIAAASAARGSEDLAQVPAYDEAPAAPLAAADLPAVADRPLSGTIDAIEFATSRDDLPR